MIYDEDDDYNEDPYYNRASRDDSETVASGCLVILVLFLAIYSVWSSL